MKPDGGNVEFALQQNKPTEKREASYEYIKCTCLYMSVIIYIKAFLPLAEVNEGTI